MTSEVGKTKEGWYQFGLRKTFPISVQEAWGFLLSDKGLRLWLGDLTKAFSHNQDFKTKDGIEGHVRVIKPNSHIRITWKKKDWNNNSLLQVRVIEKSPKKCVISFHHEKLSDVIQREEMKLYWNAVMNRLIEELI